MIQKVALLSLFFASINILAADVESKFTFSNEKNRLQLMTSIVSQSTNITTDSSSTSIKGSSDFSVTAQKVTGEYFFDDRFSFVGSYFFGLIIDIDAEVQGFDLGVQYFPLSNGSSKSLEFDGSVLKTSPEWSPYIYMGASTRDYQFSSLSLKFQGIEMQGGTYWHFSDDYFLKGNLFYQQHKNNNVRTLQTTGIGIGIGIKF